MAVFFLKRLLSVEKSNFSTRRNEKKIDRKLIRKRFIHNSTFHSIYRCTIVTFFFSFRTLDFNVGCLKNVFLFLFNSHRLNSSFFRLLMYLLFYKRFNFTGHCTRTLWMISQKILGTSSHRVSERISLLESKPQR